MGDIWISARKEGLATNDGKFTWCILWRNCRNYSTLESVPKGMFFLCKRLMKSIVISLTFYDDRKKISMVSEESVWKHGGEK